MISFSRGLLVFCGGALHSLPVDESSTGGVILAGGSGHSAELLKLFCVGRTVGRDATIVRSPTRRNAKTFPSRPLEPSGMKKRPDSDSEGSILRVRCGFYSPPRRDVRSPFKPFGLFTLAPASNSFSLLSCSLALLPPNRRQVDDRLRVGVRLRHGGSERGNVRLPQEDQPRAQY